MAAVPLTLMGAGPRPTRPRRHLWEEKSTVKLKDENEETHEFQNFVAQAGSAPKPAKANAKSMVRLTSFDSFLSASVLRKGLSARWQLLLEKACSSRR